MGQLRSAYEDFPFGGSGAKQFPLWGKRHCIGVTFALSEMKLVLATILSQHKLTLIKQAPVKPIR